MQVYYDETIDPAAIQSKTIAIIGYGNQGRAHALNLRDSGACDVIVGAREGRDAERTAQQDGFEVMSIPEAAGRGDLVALLTPDETHKQVFADHLAENISPRATLLFAHGFSVNFGLVKPRSEIDQVLVAPRGPGRSVRKEYENGMGLPATAAVANDASGAAMATALAYARGIGCGRAGVFVSTFEEECVTDLFGEQTVLCGGMLDLARAAFETLVEAGFAPEMAYFECIYEMKRIVDLIEARGFPGMRKAISNTAEFGGFIAGSKVVTAETKQAMAEVLEDIRSGRFAESWMEDWETGARNLTRYRDSADAHPAEEAEASIRRLTRLAVDD